MTALRSILCPVDFSDQSRSALRWAGALGRRHRSHLTVLSAIDPLLAEAARMRLGMDLARSDIDPALREFVEGTWPDEASRPANVKYDIRIGNAPDVILAAAASVAPDLIVMGTHGLGGFRKWLIGSTTERVLRRTRTPLLAVPPSAPEPAFAGEAAAVPQLGAIVAATDFSETSLRALRWAADLAQEFGSPLFALHIVEPLVVAPQWQAYVEQADETRIADARARLQSATAQLGAAVRREALVVSGLAADSIASAAEERHAGLIVMGLASSPAPFGSQPGSIAYRVLTLAKTPVLVVPSDAASPTATRA
jgi:nucleotide-binding universal stress UspA family protein